jgi:TolA-binding protein
MTQERPVVRGSTDHAEDLSVLCRRGVLSEPQRRRLELCLASSPSLRLFHEIGCDFDRIEAPLAGDRALVQQMAARARERYGRRSAGRRGFRPVRSVAVTGGAAILLGVLGAAAAYWQTRTPPVEQNRPPKAAPAALSARPRASLVTRSADPELVRDHQAAEPPSASPGAPGAQQRVTERGATDTMHDLATVSSFEAPTEPTGPAELFSFANGARHRGDLGRAVALYRRLQAEYPRSDESVLSQVLLARVHLGRGENAAALEQFERYLRTAGDGSLVQEAMHGKAMALRRLGRVSEERSVWHDLLRRFPDSVYGGVARERLVEGD